MIQSMRHDPDLSKVLDVLSKHSILTAKEEQALLALAQSGNDAAGRKLCSHNLRFIIKVANRFRGTGLPMEDLINEGVIGLMKAVTRFDQSTGLRFISYGIWWIQQAIIKAINEKSRLVNIPVEHNIPIQRLKKTRLCQVIGGHYVEDLQPEADRANIRPDYLATSLLASRGGLSLDQPIRWAPGGPDVGITPAEIISSDYPKTDSATETRERVDILNRLRGKLSPNQRQVITLYYGLDGGHPATLREISIKIGLSHERVRQIKIEALAIMKRLGRKYME